MYGLVLRSLQQSTVELPGFNMFNKNLTEAAAVIPLKEQKIIALCAGDSFLKVILMPI
jgi:hypothetical protein